MKKARRALLPLLILALALVLGVTALAADGETLEKTVAPAAANVTASGTCGDQGDNVKWTLTDDGTLTISGTGKMDDWWYSFNLAPWYDYKESVKTVVIQSGVTSIGGYAFYECTSLTSVTISSGVTIIGHEAFGSCTSLTSVTIPSGVTIIESSAFSECTSLTSVTIPNSVTRIEGSAFDHCQNLKSVSLPSGLVSIGSLAFQSCGLTSVTIPASVTSIERCPFAYCFDLPSINVANGNKNYCSVDGVLFSKDQSTLVEYPYGKSGTYTIPNSVTTIEDCAFWCCDRLTNITIPNSVTSIREYAFVGCHGLTSMTIPVSVTSIGVSVFNDCVSLQAINVASGNQNYCSVGGVLFSKDKTTLVRYPIGKSGTSYTIPDSVTAIGGFAFFDHDGLTSITIPNSVTSIGFEAFLDCDSLTRVTIPASVTSIGETAFGRCKNLSIAVIPASVTKIGFDVFYGCSPDLTIYGEAGSAIETYAKENGIKFSTGEAPKYPLPAPTGVTVSSEATGIKVSWTKVSGAAKYRVFYKPEGGSWTKAGDTTATSYTWTGAKSGTTYQIRVRCITSDGKTGTSDFSASQSITYTKPSTYKYAAPTGVKVENANTGIKVTWTKVNGAAKYRVFYKPEGGSWTKAGDTTSASYTWTGAKSGTTYQIRVRCITSDGKTGTSDFSAAKSIKYIAAPKDVKVSSTSTGIKITWTKSTGAAKYRIYYKTGSGSWKTLTHTTSNSYTWTGAKNGTKYTFRVRCATGDGKSVTSSYTADKSITYKKTSTYKYEAPTGVKVSNDKTGIKVTWTKVSGAAKYRVFYKPSGGSWTKAGDTTATSYTWTKAKSGTTYQIRVRCITSDGKTGTSDFSTTKTIKYIAAPKDVKVSSTSTGIKITWTKSAGAAKYRIYYKTAGGSWKTLTHTTSNSYTWTGAKDGVKYTFRVRCVASDAKTVTSGYTADKTITYKK